MKRDLHEKFGNLIEKSIISDLSTEEEKIKFFRNPPYKSAFAGQYYVKEIKSFSILGH